MNKKKMAFSNVLVVAFFAFLLVATRSSAADPLAACKFDAIYQFGDSLSDTGNSVFKELPEVNHDRPPFGKSIGKATGRISDGLLMIDYIAQSAGLPLLEIYKKLEANVTKLGANVTQGVNFAVAGSTASDVIFLAKMQVEPPTKSSLNVQLGRFDTFLHSLCGNDKGNCDQKQKLKSALFILGTIGINDYTYALEKNNISRLIKDLLPNIINVIINATETLIDRGAVRVVVPGTHPAGCSPSAFSNRLEKDKYGCMKVYNDFAVYHNKELQKALIELAKKYPNVRIVYGDMYNAFLYVLDNSSKFGFRELFKACCGTGGGEHNFNGHFSCGKDGSTACDHPNEYISWDGAHMTGQTYKYMAEWFIRDIVPKLGCK